MSDKPEQTAEEKMADALPAYPKYVAAHPNNRIRLLAKPHTRFRCIRPDKVGRAADHTLATGRRLTWREP
jgi:hypothetical protein